MPDTPHADVAPVLEVQNRLRDVARMLRDSAALEPAVRGALAELMDELSRTLDAPAAPQAETARLAADVAQLAEALHHRHDRGLLERLGARLYEWIERAEAHAPTAVGLGRRVADALADMGI